MRAPSLAPALALVACAEPIVLDWKVSLPESSVSTPCVTADFVAVGHGLGLTVVGLDGEVICQFGTGGEVVSSPKSDGDAIYFGSVDYGVYAIDRRCAERWRFLARDRIKSDAHLGERDLVVSSYDGHVYALDKATGALRWRFPKEGAAPGQPGGDAGAAMKVGDFSYSSPAAAGDTLIVGNLDGYLYVLAKDSGELIWRFRTDGPVTSSPRVVGARAYVGSNDGHVYALDLQTRSLLWKLKTGHWVNSSPRLHDDLLYVGSNDRHLYAASAETGALRWRFAARGPVVGVPAVYEDLVFFGGGSGDGALYAVERKGGGLFWRHQTAGKIDADPVVRDRRVYVTGGRELYAFSIRRTPATSP